MPSTPAAKDPVVLSYAALRRSVGIVAVAFPFVVTVPVYLLCDHTIASSLSANYYQITRNFFVGTLCAISLFMFCDRGYDLKDEIAGILSSIFALGVAFFPTTPDECATHFQKFIGHAHYFFATALFSTLAYFCLVLFRTTAVNRHVTHKKLQRNKVYRACGIAIVASMAAIAALSLLDNKNTFNVDYWIKRLHTTPILESIALIAFGLAWLVKGDFVASLNDPNPAPTQTLTTNRIFGLVDRAAPESDANN